MEKENEEELKRLDERLEEAEKTEGETEIADALKARATYLTRIGDKVSYVSFTGPRRDVLKDICV
jgi:26S proteasome regulatory subunit N7